MQKKLAHLSAFLRPQLLPFGLMIAVILSDPSPVVGCQRDAENDEVVIQLFDQQLTDQGRGITQVFLVSDKCQIHDTGTAKNIVLPEGVKNKGLAYFRIYFTGRKGKVEKGIIVLVVGYQSDRPNYYVDLNNNLDFSDDGDTQCKECENGGFILSLTGDNPDSEFAINLIPFGDEENITAEKKKQFSQMFEGFRQYMGGEFANADYWYFNRRLNTRTNSVVVDGKKVLLGLHDYDCDGLYSGERDRVIAGDHSAEHVSYALADGAVNAIRGEIFLVGDSPYKLVEASDDGRKLHIAKSNKMPDRLFVGTKVPNLKLKSLDGETVELQELLHSDKLLVIDFWGHWCGPCIAAIPSCVEFQDKWKDKLTFVGVHSGDHEAAKKLLTDNEASWKQFETSPELEETFFIDAWPSYVVIDENGTLVSFRSSLKEMAKLLGEKSDE